MRCFLNSEEFTDFLLIPLKNVAGYNPPITLDIQMYDVYIHMCVLTVIYGICHLPRDLDSIAILLEFPFKKKQGKLVLTSTTTKIGSRLMGVF